MDRIKIVGGNRLEGKVRVSGAKNASLPILAACLLTEGECILDAVPCLRDVEVMLDVLRSLGARANWEGSKLVICARDIVTTEIPEPLMRKMRASNLVMGALLGRFGRFKAFTPGGCAIGSRPMDLHLKGFNSLGAKITHENGYILGDSQRIMGASLHLDFPSVGATENLMMAAALAQGNTVIRNAAREPEITDLQDFLCTLGAKIQGAGSNEIHIEGVSKLGSGAYTVMPDRIEAGTLLVAGAITGGDVWVVNAQVKHVEAVTAKLEESGAKISTQDGGIRVIGSPNLKAVDIRTLPYPGFPTDMQPQFAALLALTRGTSVVTETIFESRFKHVGELRRMGAEIRVEGKSMIILGAKRLTGAVVEASDLRAGAALILAGMAAEGITQVEGIEHIDRGYANIEAKMQALGGRIWRI